MPTQPIFHYNELSDYTEAADRSFTALIQQKGNQVAAYDAFKILRTPDGTFDQQIVEDAKNQAIYDFNDWRKCVDSRGRVMNR